MIRGLYSAASGMMTQMVKQDVIANNMANVNASGFKRDNAVSKAFPEMLLSRIGEVKQDSQGRIKAEKPEEIGRLGTGVAIDEITTDFSIGNMKKTDVPTDIAIKGKGYYVIATPEGQERFTRSSCFAIDNINGEMLLTNQGFPVLDTNNEYINIESSDFNIDKNGYVYVDGEEYTQLKVAIFANDDLQKTGNNLLTSDQGYEVAETPQLIPGFIEESNVNAVKEMVDLISVVRSYESLQKVVQAEDESIEDAIEKVGSTS